MLCILQPALSPRRLCMFNTMTGSPLQELNFLTSILAVRMNKRRQGSLLYARICFFLLYMRYDKEYLFFPHSMQNCCRSAGKNFYIRLEQCCHFGHHWHSAKLKRYFPELNNCYISLYIFLIQSSTNSQILWVGLCAFSYSLDGCFLALPASTTKGSVLVYNVMEFQSHCEVVLACY